MELQLTTFCFFFSLGLWRDRLEGLSTPPIFLPVDCSIDIISKTVLEQGIEYALEGIVSSIFGCRILYYFVLNKEHPLVFYISD